MADQYLTLKDIAARQGTDDVVGLIENVVNVAPEIDQIVGRMIPSTHYEARVRIAVASNAAFRKFNSGVPLSASAYGQKRFNCFPFDCQMRVDEATLLAAEGNGDSMGKVLSEEASGVMVAKAIALGKQFYAGTTNDANGCAGMIDFLTDARKEVDSRNGKKIDQAIDLTCSTAGVCEIVWFLKTGPQGVHWLFGGNRGLTFNPWMWQQVTSADNKGKQRAMCSNLFGFLGTSCANYHAVGAIVNVDNTSTTYTPAGHALNDNTIAQLWAKFPIGIKPDVCYASQKVIAQLQQARTVTLFGNLAQGTANGGGAANIAPWPTNLPTAGNIPIIPTDSIVPGNAVTLS